MSQGLEQELPHWIMSIVDNHPFSDEPSKETAGFAVRMPFPSGSLVSPLTEPHKESAIAAPGGQGDLRAESSSLRVCFSWLDLRSCPSRSIICCFNLVRGVSYAPRVAVGGLIGELLAFP